jgi:hypothetical protein
MSANYININFEVLEGCPFSCEGCFVNKQASRSVKAKSLENLESLILDIKENGGIIHTAFIGPVDFLASSNITDILENKNYRRIFSYFKKLSFQSTFADFSRGKEVAEKLNLYKDLDIEVNVVIRPENYSKPNYVKNLTERLFIFKTYVNRFDIETYGIVNAFEFDDAEDNYFQKLHSEVGNVISTGIDFNFSVGRAPSPNKEEFEKYALFIKKIHEEVEVSNPVNVEPSGMVEKERQLNYIGENVFYSPLYYERVPVFSDYFKIDLKEFKYSEILLFEERLKEKQHHFLNKTKDCSGCNHLELCLSRGTIGLMEYLSMPDCHLPRQNPKFIYDMGTLPLVESL